MQAAPLAVPALLLSLVPFAPNPFAPGTEEPVDPWQTGTDIIVCPDQVVHAPILVMDEIGDVLGLPVHREMTLYDDGTVRLGTSIEAMGHSEFRVAHADDGAVSRLLSTLADAGVWELCDKPDWGSTLPMMTIAMLRGGPDGAPHSFSFRPDAEEYVQVADLVADFRASVFYE